VAAIFMAAKRRNLCICEKCRDSRSLRSGQAFRGLYPEREILRFFATLRMTVQLRLALPPAADCLLPTAFSGLQVLLQSIQAGVLRVQAVQLFPGLARRGKVVSSLEVDQDHVIQRGLVAGVDLE